MKNSAQPEWEVSRTPAGKEATGRLCGVNVHVLPLLFIAAVYAAMIWLNERYDLFSVDRFPSPAAKWGAYAWLGAVLFLLTALVTKASQHTPTARELARIPFYSLFGMHAILLAFLAGWWLLTQRPPLADYLNIRRDHAGELVLGGFAIGLAGWIFTLMVALLVGLILAATGLAPKNMTPPPMIAWLAAQPIWKKALIVLSAMTVEEAFFRGWLQKRVGLIVSTALFALAHSGFGQPLLLIGVTVVSLVIGTAFYRTKSLIPGVMAHGVFDAVQLFVIIPIVFKAGLGV
jgi:membrane protease YdiL (CAAX protease family)